MNSFTVNLILSSPRILLRWFLFVFKSKRVIFHEFRAINVFCINGTLNQLVWNVEGSVFVTISNSNKIYFKNNELIFLVNNSLTEFTITLYGINGKQSHKTGIKVVTLNQKKQPEIQPLIFRFVLKKMQFSFLNKNLKIMNDLKSIKKNDGSERLTLNTQDISTILDKVSSCDSIFNLDQIKQET